MKIFSKDRMKQVKIFDDMSELDGLVVADKYSYTARRDEYYVVQLLVVDACGAVDINVEGLREIAMIYNTEGTDKHGATFNKAFIATKPINPVYIGFDFTDYAPGNYTAKVQFSGESTKVVELSFKVLEEVAPDHGYNDIHNLSRLNWLNSKTALDDELIAPFTAIEELGKNCYGVLGRKFILDEGLNLVNVEGYFDESVNIVASPQRKLLAEPVSLMVGTQKFVYGDVHCERQNSVATLRVSGQSEDFDIETSAVLKCEGQLEYFVKLTAKKKISADVSLTLPFDNNCAEYNMGLGYKGGKYRDIQTGWGNMRHDSLFVGTVNMGALIRLKAENYRVPLVNVYYANLPIITPTTTWDNNGKGNIGISKKVASTCFCACTGSMDWQSGQTRVFRYELFVTPYKPIDYKKHYATRYYHSNNMGGNEYKHLDIARQKKMNYLVVHHGNELHPYINYPFIETERLKRFVNSATEQNIGVKLYYTTREMSNHTAEVFAFKALGNEIIMQKKGKGLDTFNKRDWLNKYFADGVIPAWQVHYKSGAHKGDHDIAFIIQPDSRLDNYYIEGLQWLVDNIGIKGIYIDDTSLDATTVRRAKKILSKVDGLIDMHMWNHEEARAGDAACLNIYADILPFMDNLWIGEGFDCRKLSADYIFTEVAGLMFGNTSQMLENGGDLNVGMLYGMNNRYGWGHFNADKLYAIWDDFGIENSAMYGYWHSKNPIKSNRDDVKITVYKQKDKALVAIYNFNSNKQNYDIKIDIEALGFKPTKVKIHRTENSLILPKVNLFSTNMLKGRQGVLIEIAL